MVVYFCVVSAREFPALFKTIQMATEAEAKKPKKERMPLSRLETLLVNIFHYNLWSFQSNNRNRTVSDEHEMVHTGGNNPMFQNDRTMNDGLPS